MRRGTAAVACGGVGAGAIATALSMTVAAGGGCYNHQCDPSPAVALADAGMLVPSANGEVEWKSSPLAGPWLDFPGERSYVLYYPMAFATPPDLSCEISADVDSPQHNFVECGGNLAQFFDAGTTSVGVFNPSCAGYGLLVTARGVPASTDGGSGGSAQDSPGD